MFGRHKILTPEKDFSYFLKVDSVLCKTLGSSKHTIEYHKRIVELKRGMIEKELNEKRVSIGNPAPEISFMTPDKKVIHLSSLKGKTVLLNFWASWCAPCRKESHTLVNIYEKYKKKGFEIYSVSLDKEKQKWEQAIKQDKYSWINVSDLNFWDSPIIKTYNIKEIPYFIIIDKKGIISYKTSNINDLNAKIKEIITK
jgi:peroxiredoxin